MTRPNEPSLQKLQTSPNVVDLSAWARDLFKDITGAGYPKAEDRVAPETVPVSNPAPATNITNEHPVEPATTSIPHKGEIGR